MNVETTAKRLFDLYFGNKELALAEVFCMAKAYAGKKGDMPNAFWRDVFIALNSM